MKQFNIDASGTDALFRNMIGHLPTIARFHEQRSHANYPPYNIEVVGSSPDQWRLTLAVAGFARDNIEMNVTDGILVIKGSLGTLAAEDQPRPPASAWDRGSQPESNFLHRGIAFRDFAQQFKLDQWVEVTGATLENGLLVIDLVREVPEARKPKIIAIA